MLTWNDQADQDSYKTQGNFLIDPNSSAGDYKIILPTLNSRIFCEKQFVIHGIPYFILIKELSHLY